MSRFSDKLGSKIFLVTVELNPPKGVDVQSVLDSGESMKELVDAFNVTDSQGSNMTTGPLSLSRLLLEKGVEPIIQFTGRDRNRIALQSDMLSAYVLGLENILCLTGDPPSGGDHPEAKPVFDLDGVRLVKVASDLRSGADMSGHELKGSPRFCIGAAVNPGADDLEKETSRMRQKAEMGADFFQSQAIFHAESFTDFMARVGQVKVPVLAGIILLKSARMARYLNEHLPGIYVPEELIQEIDGAEDKSKKAIEIAARTIREVKDACRGVHIMAIGWEKYIPQVLEEAGLDSAR